MDQDPTYCQKLLRNLDYDRYLANLYLAPEFRDVAMVLDAFDAEIARIPLLIREPMPGEIRLQWWREAISGQRKEEATSNPLAATLLACIKRYEFPQAAFQRYLEARAFDLYQDPMPDMPTLEGYLGEIQSVFFQMKINVQNPNPNSRIADLCGYAGLVSGIAQLIRNLHFHRATKRIYVPASLIKAAGLSLPEWLAPKIDERHRTAVGHLAQTGLEHYDRVVSIMREEDLQLYLPVFLTLAHSREYLKRAIKKDNHIFEVEPRIGAIRKHWILWRCARKNSL